MPIVVNGTTIPENVANVLNVNGTNITSVVCNGVTVWTQNLIVREPASGEYYSAVVPYSVWLIDTFNDRTSIKLNNVLIITNLPGLTGATSYSIGGWTYYRGTLKQQVGNLYYAAFYRISN